LSLIAIDIGLYSEYSFTIANAYHSRRFRANGYCEESASIALASAQAVIDLDAKGSIP